MSKDTIKIRNTGGAPVSLPQFTRPLVAGDNTIPKEAWDVAQEHKMVATMVESGRLKVIDSKAEKEEATAAKEAAKAQQKLAEVSAAAGAAGGGAAVPQFSDRSDEGKTAGDPTRTVDPLVKEKFGDVGPEGVRPQGGSTTTQPSVEGIATGGQVVPAYRSEQVAENARKAESKSKK